MGDVAQEWRDSIRNEDILLEKLRWAVCRRNERKVRKILAMTPTIPTNKLWEIIHYEFLETFPSAPSLRLLIEYDPQVARIRGDEGHFLLHYACARRVRFEIIELLINVDTDEEATLDALNDAAPLLTQDGTLLVQVLKSAISHHRAVAKFRLIFRVITITTEQMVELIMDAFQCYMNSAVLRVLIQQDPETAQWQDHDGWHLFHFACKYDAPTDIVGLLLDLNGDVTFKMDEYTLFQLNIVETLVEYDPSFATMKNDDGQVALSVACAKAAPIEVVRFLLDKYPYGAYVQDRYGRLPLHHALAPFTTKKNLEVIRLLVERNPATLSVADIYGQLPIDEHLRWYGDFEETYDFFTIWHLLLDRYEGDKNDFHGLAVTDEQGGVLLHRLFWGRGVEMPVLVAVIQHYPGGVHVMDIRGNLPLHALSSNPEFGTSLESLHLLLEIDILTVLHLNENGQSPLRLAFDARIRHYFRVPSRATVEFLRDKQDEAVDLVRMACALFVVKHCKLPAVLARTVTSFILPSYWKPSDADLARLH